jgi:hypothetical protein
MDYVLYVVLTIAAADGVALAVFLWLEIQDLLKDRRARKAP